MARRLARKGGSLLVPGEVSEFLLNLLSQACDEELVAQVLDEQVVDKQVDDLPRWRDGLA
jgi:hypothetical protein